MSRLRQAICARATLASLVLALALAAWCAVAAAHAPARGSAHRSAHAAQRAHVRAQRKRPAPGRCRARTARTARRAVRRTRACAAHRTAKRRSRPVAPRAKVPVVHAPAPSVLLPVPLRIDQPLDVGPGPEPQPDAPPSPPSDDGAGGGGGEPPAPPPAPPAPPAPAGNLRWAPPTLVNPITVQLGTGYTHTVLSPTRDYIVKLPATQKVGGTWLDGGHDIVLIGGSVAIPYAAPGAATSAQRTGIYIKGATGTVHIEGVLIDGTGGGEMDGVDVAAPQATVQLENLRIVGVHGGLNSFHADVVQPWGGVRDLRIDHLTGASNYQGLMLSEALGPIGSAEISNVDLTATTDPPVDHGGHMLMVSSNVPQCATYPIALSNVFVQPRPGRTLINSVWPASVASTCDGVSGDPLSGLPPAGSFVPAGVAGVGYVSTGYAGS